MFVLKRTDQGGGYVARPGSASSYTHRLEDAQGFRTLEEALAARCPGNEVPVSVDQLIAVRGS